MLLQEPIKAAIMVQVAVAKYQPIEFGWLDAAQTYVKTKTVTAIVFLLPDFQGAQHLCREGFVDFVEVKILQLQTSALQHFRNSDGWCHQQAFVVDEING